MTLEDARLLELHSFVSVAVLCAATLDIVIPECKHLMDSKLRYDDLLPFDFIQRTNNDIRMTKYHSKSVTSYVNL